MTFSQWKVHGLILPVLQPWGHHVWGCLQQTLCSCPSLSELKKHNQWQTTRIFQKTWNIDHINIQSVQKYSGTMFVIFYLAIFKVDFSSNNQNVIDFQWAIATLSSSQNCSSVNCSVTFEPLKIGDVCCVFFTLETWAGSDVIPKMAEF